MNTEFSGYNTDITPTEFEQLVKGYLEKIGTNLIDLKVSHNVNLESYDGSYQIDVYAEFEAFNTTIKVLIECKKHKNLIKREVVQLLYDKLRATGCHKGIIFSTCGFQSGAYKFAELHGIALITVLGQELTYITKSNTNAQITEGYRQFFNLSKYVGQYIRGASIYFLQDGYVEALEEFITDKKN